MAAHKGLTINMLLFVGYKLRFCAYFAMLYFGIIYLWELKMIINGFRYAEIDFTHLEYFEDQIEYGTFSKGLQRTTDVYHDRDRMPSCPPYPRRMLGHLALDDSTIRNRSWLEIQRQNTDVLLGGKFIPRECIPRYKVAIIIPFRKRDNQLRTLLSHMHPIWKRQDISYQVYVITQIDGALFNRAKLLNIGVSEARKGDFAFHATLRSIIVLKVFNILAK